MSTSARPLSVIARRLDALALDQLRTTAAALSEQNDALRSELVRAEATAEFWQEEAMRLHDDLAETTGGARALTVGGHLVVTAQGRHA